MLKCSLLVYLFILLHYLYVGPVNAQTNNALTRTVDTSYTVHSAFQTVLKTHPQAQWVNPSTIRETAVRQNVTYCNNEGRKLLTDIFYPVQKAKTKRTAVIIVHGGGWRSGNKSLHHPMAQQLAVKGYVCFTPEYRLSTEALFPAAVHDLKAVVRWVKSQATHYNIDTNKLVIAGHSAGGELAAFIGATNGNIEFEGDGCATSFSSKVNAVIDMDGILAFIHPESGEGDDSKRTSAATHWFGASKKENEALWKQGSPLTHIGPYMPPTLFINSAVDRMHAGRDDFTHILDQYNIYHQVKTFEGAPHSFPLFEPWFTPTVQTIDKFIQTVFKTDSLTANPVIIVAQDGSGQYATVQAAFDAIPKYNSHPYTVYIRKGIYQEKLYLDSTLSHITLLGEDKYQTILTYNDHTGKLSPKGDTINTYTSHSFLQASNDFTARNITFQNDAGITAGQAVAINITGDRSAFYDCRFIGNQDVLFPSRATIKQYFEDCYIEGTTDFIFGPSTAWFEKCHIHSKKESHITAASTPKESPYGYVFNECILTGDTALRNVSLGRPWRPYANVIYLNSWMGKHIRPQGWDNWKNPANEITARYAEYNSSGPGAMLPSRVKWIRQLDSSEAQKITRQQVLGDWSPKARTNIK
jgi:pectinesterase